MTRTAPKISVIMGVHNEERYLAQALESMLSQTLGDIEILVADDCSDDNTSNILASYKDDRLKVTRNPENYGLTRTLNHLMQVAQADLLARMDGDDFSEPSRLEEQFKFMTKHPECAVVGTYYQSMDSSDNIFAQHKPPRRFKRIKETLPLYNCLCHGSVVMRKKIILDLGGYRTQLIYAQDYDLWLRVADRHKLANLPEFLYRLRLHKDSITNYHNFEQEICRKFIVEMSGQREENGIDCLEDPEKRETAIKKLRQELCDERLRLDHYIKMVNGLRRYAAQLESERENSLYNQSAVFYLKRLIKACLSMNWR